MFIEAVTPFNKPVLKGWTITEKVVPVVKNYIGCFADDENDRDFTWISGDTLNDFDPWNCF